jgi:transcriptional regulator with XRE-family HTH domain
MGAGESPVQRASLEFVAELTRWRVERGLSKKQLAAAMGFDPSYVSHVEARRHRPTEDFARRAETILQTDGTLWERYRNYDELRMGARLASRLAGAADAWLPPGTGLVVDKEVANLTHAGAEFRCTVRRSLYNAGPDPVTRYPVRIAVDRFPEEPERSNSHHRQYPLSWEEVALTARCGDEIMAWTPKNDRDASKEAWLLFENGQGRFPLYPGQRAMIAYAYSVNFDKWGPYFQRSVRLPTRKLLIELDFPAYLRPAVWGVETSLSAEAAPLRTPIMIGHPTQDRVVYSWNTDNPTLHAWYRLEWRFRGARTTESQLLGESVLHKVAGPVSASRGALSLIPKNW